MNSDNKIKYNEKKYLTSMLFHVSEALSNIERNWVSRRDFYKLLILVICAYVVNNSLRCIITETYKVICNS